MLYYLCSNVSLDKKVSLGHKQIDRQGKLELKKQYIFFMKKKQFIKTN